MNCEFDPIEPRTEGFVNSTIRNSGVVTSSGDINEHKPLALPSDTVLREVKQDSNQLDPPPQTLDLTPFREV